MRRHLTAISAALAAALLLSSCGSSSAEPDPMPPSASSTTPSPTAAPPTMPAAASEQSKAGAIEFARHYVRLINHAQASGDVSSLRAVESPQCKSCAQAAAFVEDLYQSGGAIRGGDFRILGANAVRDPSTNGWLVELGVSFEAQVIDYPEPKPDEHPKGGRLPLNLNLAWHEMGWRVSEWTRGA